MSQPSQPSAPSRPPTLWSRLVFQRLFASSLYWLIVFLFKMYEDFTALKTYYSTINENIYYFTISLLCIVLPPLFYALYLLGSLYRESQVAVRERRHPQQVELKVAGVNVTTGLLLIFWQIKSHLDKLSFATQRICFFRTKKDDEAEDIKSLKRRADVLEFFTDFYAGFLQIVLQLYLFVLETANPQVKSAFIIFELISSALSIKSMLIAIQRGDDDFFAKFASYLGWAAMFTCRVIVFALAAVWCPVWLLLIGLVHVLGFTCAVWKLALESYKPPKPANADGAEPGGPEADAADAGPDGPEAGHRSPNSTLLFILTLLFFGLPSLLLWPFMFQLKRAPWPYIFLGVTSLENCLFISAWWFYRSTTTSLDSYALLVVISGTLIANISLIGYLLGKTETIDRIVQNVMAGSQDRQSYGIYYEFCNMVFWLKKAQRNELQLRSQQGAQVVAQGRQEAEQAGTSSVSTPLGRTS